MLCGVIFLFYCKVTYFNVKYSHLLLLGVMATFESHIKRKPSTIFSLSVLAYYSLDSPFV